MNSQNTPSSLFIPIAVESRMKDLSNVNFDFVPTKVATFATKVATFAYINKICS